MRGNPGGRLDDKIGGRRGNPSGMPQMRRTKWRTSKPWHYIKSSRKGLIKEGNRPCYVTYQISYVISNMHHSELSLETILLKYQKYWRPVSILKTQDLFTTANILSYSLFDIALCTCLAWTNKLAYVKVKVDEQISNVNQTEVNPTDVEQNGQTQTDPVPQNILNEPNNGWKKNHLHDLVLGNSSYPVKTGG